MNEEYLDTYEANLCEGLRTYLTAKDEIDAHFPDMPDIEEKWQAVAEAYLPDGVREFSGYPTVSLGWMMYVGMAVAQMWDEDWTQYGQVADLYAMLREPRGYDCMDEYIREEVLHLLGEDFNATENLVNDTATITLRRIQHEQFEHGSPLAFHAYVKSLHQLYLMGAAVQMKRMGYHMQKVN